MARSSERLLTVILALLLVLILAGVGVKRMTDAGSVAKVSFVGGKCPFVVGGGPFRRADVRCGFLQVPENREVANGRTIKLAVAVFKAGAAQSAADPFIYLVGGPGGAIVQSMGSSVATNGMPGYVGNRDLILVDQRGTGLSRPSLACPEFDAVGRGATKQPLAQEKLFTLEHQAIQRCRARLIAAGIDLNAYNTVENAADIADLWKALGYQHVNVYGGSYGARLALQVMRDHPDGIRSVVVDAVADPTFNQYNDEIPNAWRSIQRMFTECAAAPGCRAAYPHLRATFDEVVARLQAHPVSGRELVAKWGGTYPVRINGVRFAGLLMSALYSPDLIPVLPALIAEAARGEYARLFQVDGMLSAAGGSNSEGMYLSAECADDQAGSSRASIAASAAGILQSIRDDVVVNVVDALTLCTIWNVKSVPAGNRELFSSAIPALLLEGSFDPRTPPAKAQAVARKLTRGWYLEFPSLGHGVVGHGLCADAVVSRFLASPGQGPNAGCVAGMARAFN